MIYEMRDKRMAEAIREERSEVDCLLREEIYPSNGRGKTNKRADVLFHLSFRALGNLLRFAPRPALKSWPCCKSYISPKSTALNERLDTTWV